MPAFATAIVGVLTITGLRALIPNLPTPGAVTRSSSSTAASKGDSRPESPLDHTAYAKGSAGAPARRNFLLGAAGVTVGAAALGALGQKLAVPATDPASIALPKPQNTLAALPTGLEGKVKGITRFRTPIEEFYRVDTALVIPRDRRRRTGSSRSTGRSTTSSRSPSTELLTMPMIEKDITLNCVSNEVGGPYISSARWLGVRVRDLLERAGIQDGVDQILSESTDGMTISTPVEALTDDRDAIIAVAMDGEPLPARHGFPARLVTPGSLRLRGRHQVADQADRDDVCRGAGLLDQARLVDRRHRQDPGADRHARTVSRPSPPARSRSAAWPGPSAAASPRSRSGSTTVPGRRPPSAPTAGPTTGVSGSGCGTPRPAGTT